MPISTIYGALRWSHTSFSPRTSSCPTVCTCGSHTSTIFNPNSTLGQLSIMYEYSRTRKYFQLTHDRLVQAELALRFWREHQNLFVWAPIPLFACRFALSLSRTCSHPRMATEVELPIHLPIFSPEEGSFETTCDEQCTVWVGYTLASCSPSLRSQGDQRHPGFRPFPTSPPTLAHDP